MLMANFCLGFSSSPLVSSSIPALKSPIFSPIAMYEMQMNIEM